MAKFKIRETYKLVGWTTVEASSPEEAQKLFEDGKGTFREDYDDWLDTDWDTLEEVV